jgi:hypothetical protein
MQKRRGLNDFERFKVMKMRKQVRCSLAMLLLCRPIRAALAHSARCGNMRLTRHAGSLRGPEDLCSDPRQRQGISSLVAVGRHGVVVVAACKGMVRHDVHFHEHSRATLGIQKFKTWNSGELVQWLAWCNSDGMVHSALTCVHM